MGDITSSNSNNIYDYHDLRLNFYEFAMELHIVTHKYVKRATTLEKNGNCS